MAPGESVVAVAWHPRIQQLFCATGGGATRVLYDPGLSRNGALLSAPRAKPRREAVGLGGDFAAGAGIAAIDERTIVNPHALPMYAQDDKKRKYSMIRNDDKLSRRPEMPLNGPGMQGRSQGGGGAGTHATWYMNNMREKRVKNLRDQDPREELLKYADATKGAELTRGAYGDDALRPQLAQRTAEQEEKDFVEEQRKLLES